jgi:protein translocase SecG subunit
MTTVLLVIHVMVAVALIVVVLLQRSEGGALGIGGGGGFMTGRSAGNALTKTTAVLALNADLDFRPGHRAGAGSVARSRAADGTSGTWRAGHRWRSSAAGTSRTAIEIIHA